MSFLDLLTDQLAASRDAAAANDLLGRPDLAEWWRWRVRDLEDYLRDLVSPLEGVNAT
ncbi:MAG: hypothetical protein ACXV4A_02670 [Actinomycetes bacterium]